MANTEKSFVLEIVTPEGTAAQVECDSARLTLSDGTGGRGGGSYGIRKGHAPAVFLLAEGVTTALLRGKEVLSLPTGEGFASMEGDTLSVTVCRAGESKQ